MMNRTSILLTIILISFSLGVVCFPPAIYDDGDAILNKGLNPQIFHQFGTFSSRFTVYPTGPFHPPEQCEIVQVTSLERHGSRHLSTGAHKSAVNSLQTVQEAINKSNNKNLPNSLKFLQTAQIDPIVEDLNPFGALQAWYSGRSTATVYEKLSKEAKPFIRSTGNDIPGQDRVLLTSKYWRLGYEGKPFPSKTGAIMQNSNQTRDFAKDIQPANVIIAENAMTNDTLSPSTCPGDSGNKADNISSNAQQALYANSTVLPVIGNRLQKHFAKYNIQINFTQSIITDMANLCLFQTFSTVSILHENPTIKQSRFCDLFEDDDWKILGYFMDLGMYFQAGYGDPYHKALGTGFLRELVARLKNTMPPLSPPTSLNTTLDSTPSTFPVQDGMIYMDTSHDGTMASIISSIGLKRSPTKLHSTKHAERQSYNFKFAEIAPMQGKVVFEKLHCKVKGSSSNRQHHTHPHTHHHSLMHKNKVKQYIRIRMNGATQRLHQHWCPRYDEWEGNGHICPLESFIDNLQFAGLPNEWNKCYTSLS